MIYSPSPSPSPQWGEGKSEGILRKEKDPEPCRIGQIERHNDED